MRNLKILLVVLIALVLLPFVIWNITFGLYVAIPLIAIYVGGIIKIVKEKKSRYLYMSILSGFLIYLLALPLTLSQLRVKQETYIENIQAGKGLNTVERLNVLGLNALMSTVAAPIYPEVAFETAWMMFSDGSPLKIENDFFLESPRIQKAIQSGAKSTYVRWYGKDYSKKSEARSSLALNQCTIKRDGNNVSASLNIRYPKRSDTKIKLGNITFYIQEGLFRYLDEVGWLHTYDITWTAKI